MDRIGPKDLHVGEPLPWDVYDGHGKLLLRRGEVVQSAKALERFIESGLFVQQETVAARHAAPPVEERPSALQPVIDARRLLGELHARHPEQIVELQPRMLRLVELVRSACEVNTTVALASILLMQDTNYTARHPVDVAILTCILGREMGLDDDARTSAVAAALTMNIGMVEVQEKVNAIAGPLNDKLTAMIHRHPQLGVERLEKLGVTDACWLACVRQHHENHDGTGYPDGLVGEAIALPARIIGLADRYCAMVSGRQYRGPQKPHTALRDLYIKEGQKIDVAVAGTMIRIMGLYPPGTLVRLKTGEIGVVTGPGEGPDTPAVHAVIGRSGLALEVASHRKTHTAAQAIEDVLTVDKLSIPIRFTSIWGHHARVR